MRRPPLRTMVVKVGGSLLTLPDLGTRLEELFQQIDVDRIIVFPGGGATADLVRGWQASYGFDDEVAHQLAIHALRLNAELLARAVFGAPLTVGPTNGQISIPDPVAVLARYDAEYPDDAPPHLWDVTSDSLAAWLTVRWPADELLLLKSAPCPRGQPVMQAAQSGLVDPYFAGLAGRISRVSWCCLRDDLPAIRSWLIDGAPI